MIIEAITKYEEKVYINFDNVLWFGHTQTNKCCVDINMLDQATISIKYSSTELAVKTLTILQNAVINAQPFVSILEENIE